MGCSITCAILSGTGMSIFPLFRRGSNSGGRSNLFRHIERGCSAAGYNEEFEKRNLTLRRTRNSQRKRSRERGRTLPYEAPKIEGRGFSSEHSKRRLGWALVVSEFV